MNDVLSNCADLPERHFASGELVIEQGQRSDLLYILAEGSVEVLKGEYQINIIDSAGSIFGEISVLLDLPHTASVRALEPSRFLIADNPIRFLTENPGVHVHLSQLLAKRLNKITSYLVDMKKQFEDQENHLGMVDEVLESLMHHQPEDTGPQP